MRSRDVRLHGRDRLRHDTTCVHVCAKSAQVPCKSEAVRSAVRSWLDSQSEQHLLTQTPTVLIGYRVQVYRTDGTTQWYTAVINSYDEITKVLYCVIL